MDERQLPSYHPDQLVALVGDESTELPDDIVIAMSNIMRAHADPDSAPYIGYYTPAQIEYYCSQSQPVLTPLPADRDILHIHHLDRHWVTSFYSASKRTVYICDSLRTRAHTIQVEQQVKLIYGNLSSNIEHVPVVQQKDQPLCGTLAIAFAVAYFLKTDPTKLQFDLSKVKKHLINCIQQGTVTQFPTVRAPEQLLSTYFAKQLEMQQNKTVKQVSIAEVDCHTVINRKRDKRKMKKELNKNLKKRQRLDLCDTEREDQKEKDRLRKRNERSKQSETVKNIVREQDVSRKRIERSSRSETVKSINRDRDVSRKSNERSSRSETVKVIDRERDVSRKRNEWSNKSETVKNIVRERDVSRKRKEWSNKSELVKNIVRERDVSRKKKEWSKKSETDKNIVRERAVSKKRNERSSRSETVKSTNRERDVSRKRNERSSQSETVKSINRDQDVSRKRKERSSRSETVKNIVRERDVSRKKNERSNKSETVKNIVRERDVSRKKNEWSNKSETVKNIVRERDVSRKRNEWSNKSETVKNIVRDQNVSRKRNEWSNKSETVKNIVRERDVSRKRNEWSNKSETVKNIVRDQNVSRKRKERSNKSETDKDFEKERDVNRKRSKRHEKYSLESRTVREKETANRKKNRMITSVQSAIINFRRAIKDGAVYECNSCARLMFRRSVITYVSSKYKNKELIENIDTFRKGEATNWICQTCESSLKRGSMPSLCLLNNLSLESVPDELKCLTSLELQLVSQMLPFMKVIALHTGAQHKLSGQVVLVPADLSKVATSLPRNTASAQIVTLALKRRLSDKHPYHQQVIRPAYVNHAVRYLKSTSPLYSQVQVNSNWEEDSTENSSEFWSAATGNLQNDKQVDRNHRGATEDTEIQSHKNECEASDTNAGQEPSHNNEVTDSEDEVDCDNPIEIQEELLNKASLNAVTCIQSVNGPEVQTAHVMNIAPAEGQTPTSYFKQPEWEALSFPKLFPTGVNTFNSVRPIKLSLKKYFNQRLTNKDPRFSESTEYIFQALDITERDQLQNSISLTTRKTIRGDINAGQLKDPGRINRLISTDQVFRSFKSVRATPQYWQQMQLDMLAKLRQLGPYTFFLTGSAAEFHWTEVIQVVAKQYGTSLSEEEIENMDWNTKRSWLQRNPVSVARQIDYIFEQLFGKVILSGCHPIGCILNYDRRTEMQGRGTQHFHCAIHVKNAPKLDTNSDEECIKFIDTYITCEIPDPEEDQELYSLVQRQCHHHTRTCKKNKNKTCRFSYPKAPSPETFIARVPEGENSDTLKEEARLVLQQVHQIITSPESEFDGMSKLDVILQKAGVSTNEYVSALQVAQRRTVVVLKRSPQEIMVNNYNKDILRALRANMDIQFITNIWACIAYLTSYICKPERTMSEMMKKASKEASSKPVRQALNDIGHIFIKSREVSEHEAILRVLSLPLRKSCVDVQFVQTDIPEKRTRVLKPRQILENLNDTDTDIFLPSIHEKYACRPDSLENICLADFVAKFNIGSQTNTGEEDDHDVDSDNHTKKIYHLKNKMGIISKRSTSKVIRYHNVSKQRDEEMYFHRLLILYLPWRSEAELMLEESFQKKFEEVKDVIKDNIQSYEPYNDEVEEIIENFDPDEAGPEMWTEIGIEAQQEAADTETDNTAADLPLLDPDNLNACDVDPEIPDKNPSSFTLTATNLLNDEDFLANVRKLNTQQRTLFDFVYAWATNQRLQPDTTEPFYMFLSGGAGVGKTFLVNTLYEGLVRSLRTPGQDPEKPTVLMTASTGKAASNINGMTVHSAFGLPVKRQGRDMDFSYKPPNQSRLNTMRCNFTNLKVIIIDEISMLGCTTFQNHLSCALQEIFQIYNKPYGGVSILAVGDLLQLNPVGQSPVFSVVSQGYDALAGSIWQKLFKLYELTAIVRQKGDPRFSEILNNVRVGILTEEDEQDLKALESTDTSNFPPSTVHLFRTNELAAVYNDKQLKLLPGPHVTICCQDTQKDLHTNSVPVKVTSTSIYETGGLPGLIEIADGAPFMITKNIDTSDHLVNGVIGTIRHIDISPNKPLQGCIYLEFEKSIVGKELKKTSPSGLRHLVPIKAVCSTFFITAKKTVPVERKMFPGVLAYGLTAHKSQGSTYNHMIADLQKPQKAQKMATPQGLAYTMLSRATSRAGIQVLNFSKSDITVNRKALEETKRMQTESMLNIPSLHDGDLYIGHVNIRSLNKHACDLINDPTVQQMAVLCCTETKIKRCRKQTLIPGYNMILDNRKHGLAFFVKEELVYSTLDFLLEESDIEILGIALHFDNLVYNVIVGYKPPTYPVERFLQSLQTHIRNLQNLLIIGDFNQTLNTAAFNLFLETNGFQQYIRTPTHTLGGTLDLIVSPMTNLQTTTKPLPYTDHYLIAAKLDKTCAVVKSTE